MSVKTVKTAKGIEGIREFLTTRVDTPNWHVFTVDAYVTFTGETTAREWIVKHGAKLIGFTGNSITVEL